MVEKVCNVLLVTILVVMLLIAGVLGVPQIFGNKVYSVLSASMMPTYPIGSVVFVKKISTENIEIGDVITFKASGFDALATHRVTGINYDDKSFTTKGDNNNAEDIYPVEFENVIGRVYFSIPLIGHITANLRTDAGMSQIAGLLVIVFILFTLPDFLKKSRKREIEGAQA